MNTTPRLWLGLAALLVSSFGVLLWMGNGIYQQVPPIPERVVSQTGTLIFSKSDYGSFGEQVLSQQARLQANLQNAALLPARQG